MTHQKYLIFLIGLLAVFSLITLPFNALQPDDASMYALAIKNTIQHQQWLMPLLQPGDPASFLDKPLLGIWLQAFPLALMKWISIPLNEFTVHIPNIIYYLILLLIFYLFLKKEKNSDFALLGTFILATSLSVLVYSRTPKLDILLTLAIMMGQFYLFKFWSGVHAWRFFCFWVGVGFLIKSGFAVIFCGLTFLSLFCIDSDFRKKMTKFLFQKEFYIGTGAFFIPVFIGMGLPYFAAPEQYGAYLKSILWQSKYNLSYLGLGMHWNVLGYAFLAFFPWAVFLWNKYFFFPKPKKSLEQFSFVWFVSNFLFLFLFYQQNDLRTFVSLVPPLTILVTTRLTQLNSQKPPVDVLTLLLAILLMTQTPQLISAGAILPVALWIFFLMIVFVFSFAPKQNLLFFAFAVLLMGHISLLFLAGRLVEKSNPYIGWLQKLEDRFYEKRNFYIYRPQDRPLFMSHDQAYLDFMTDQQPKEYVTQGAFFKDQKNYYLLTDPNSAAKLRLSSHQTLFFDPYSVLIWVK